MTRSDPGLTLQRPLTSPVLALHLLCCLGSGSLRPGAQNEPIRMKKSRSVLSVTGEEVRAETVCVEGETAAAAGVAGLPERTR